MILTAGVVAASSAIIVNAEPPSPWHLQLLDMPYFMQQGALPAFPIQLAYYLSEIALMTSTYILANRAWTPHGGHGVPHHRLGAPARHNSEGPPAPYGIVLIPIFYIAYEYSRTPIVPLVLWLTVLIA